MCSPAEASINYIKASNKDNWDVLRVCNSCGRSRGDWLDTGVTYATNGFGTREFMTTWDTECIIDKVTFVTTGTPTHSSRHNT